MTINSDLIKETIMDAGVDLVGIASAEDLILAYPPRPASALMPSAKSVIVMAVSHSLGAVCSPDIMLWTRSKMQTSRLLDETAEEIGRMLERKGFLTLPISADKPVGITVWGYGENVSYGYTGGLSLQTINPVVK